MDKIKGILIDAKNTIYRAVWAAYKDPNFDKEKYDYIIVVLRFLSKFRDRFMPEEVHIFWDAPKEKLWRREIFKEYKEGRKTVKDGFDAGAEVERISKICRVLFKLMGFYQYYMDNIEADDLIYSFCKIMNRNNKYIIISSDKDIMQISYYFDNISIHNPMYKKDKGMISRPTHDPVIIKSLMGDKSDNIDGFMGVGDITSERYTNDFYLLKRYLDNNDGWGKFLMNMKIIDLSMNPMNIECARKIIEVYGSGRKQFNDRLIKKLICKIRGVYGEYDRIISPFRYLKMSSVKDTRE